MNIHYIKHADIDLRGWDRCIKKSMNGSLFGYSWFLDIVSPHWDALIDDNYEHVMPLTHRSILGLKMLIQPYFATNLGVYSIQVLDCETVNQFISAIPDSYRYIRINLNKYNKLSVADIKISQDIHFELDLIEPYERIRKRYGESVKAKLTEAAFNNISVIGGLNSNDLTQLYKKRKGRIWNLFYRKQFSALQEIISTAVRYRVGEIYGAYSGGNKLCAAAFFGWSHQKVTLIFLGLNATALKEHALEAVIDEFIKQHAEQNLTLRFEYASRKKYACTYAGFGGRKFQFMNIRQSRMPWFLKWIWF